MSATAQVPGRGRVRPRRADRSVEADGRSPRVSALPVVLLVAILLAGGLLTLLLINNSLAAGSFDQARLRAEQTLLFEQEQALRQEVQRLSSPTRLRSEARQLGMVPAGTTAYFDPTTGRILGTPQASGSSDQPDPAADPLAGLGGGDPALPGTDSALVPVDPSSTGVSDGTDGAGRSESWPRGEDASLPGDTGSAARRDGAGANAQSDGGDQGGDPGDGAAVSRGDTAYDRAVVSGGAR